MTVPNDEAVYRRTIRNIERGILIFGCGGAAVAAVWKGWKPGLGFLLGAALSRLSFWRWRRVVDALGASSRPGSAAWMTVRLLGVCAAAYAIVRYLEVNPVAVLLGLFSAAASTLAAMLFELFYGKT